MSSRQRRPQKLLSIQGLEFWDDPELCFNRDLESSPWKQRGWTFQEALLSLRLLYFTNEQTVAISNLPGEGSWAETQLPPFETRSFSETSMYKDRPSLAQARCSLMLPSYLSAQLEFSSRILTYSSDRVRAFSGILHAMYGEDHLFGLPLRHFDLALIWEGNCYKELSLDYTWRVCNNFPSWSWASAPSSCGKCHRLSYDFTVVASRAFVNKNGNPEPILAVSRDYNEQSSGDCRIAVLAWDAGCMPTTKPCPIPLPTRHHKDYDGKGNEQAKRTWHDFYVDTLFPDRWLTYEEFWFESRGCDPSERPSANSFSHQGTSEDVAICKRPYMSPEYMSYFSARHVALASSTGLGRRLLGYTQALQLAISASPKTTTLPTARHSLPESSDIHTIHHSSSTRPIGTICLPSRNVACAPRP